MGEIDNFKGHTDTNAEITAAAFAESTNVAGYIDCEPYTYINLSINICMRNGKYPFNEQQYAIEFAS